MHVQALSWGQPEYYLELLPSRCPLILCLYGELLIVWQDWQAPLQSWLKALRSEKWDRYRANTCPLAVSESPTGCALHWHRINGSIKKPTQTPPTPSWRCCFGLQTTLHLALPVFTSFSLCNSHIPLSEGSVCSVLQSMHFSSFPWNLFCLHPGLERRGDLRPEPLQIRDPFYRLYSILAPCFPSVTSGKQGIAQSTRRQCSPAS